MIMKTKKKVLVSICLVFFLGLMQACQHENKNEFQTCIAGQFATYIFVDKSLSTNSNDETLAGFSDVVRTKLEQRMFCEGDIAKVFFMHAFTQGQADSWSAELAGLVSVDFSDKNSLTRSSTAAKFKRDQVSVQKNQSEKAYEFMQQEADMDFRYFTNILGALEVVSEQLRYSADASNKEVWIFSDMIEDTQGSNHHNLATEMPENATQARQMAQDDVEWMKTELNIKPERFKDVIVHIEQGSLANYTGQPQVKIYWLALFQAIGFQEDNIHYN